MPRRSTTDAQLDRAVGARIKVARRRRGWSQQRVAEAMAIQPETVSRYETGDVPVSLAVLFRLARVLGADVGELLNVPSAALSTGEAGLLSDWRLLDQRGQRLIADVVRWAVRQARR